MKAMLIFNPVAGQRDVRRELALVADYLGGRGWQVFVRETSRPGEAVLHAREALSLGCQRVFAVGGDGTVNEVLQPLVNTPVALGVLPIGTGNVWAAELGLIPTPTLIHRANLLEAARKLVEGKVVRVDVGQIRVDSPAQILAPREPWSEKGERFFLLWAGIGLDALVTQEITLEMKRRWGALAFVAVAIAMAPRFSGARATLWADGRPMRRRVILILVSNVRLYAGLVKVAPSAFLNDGLLDLYIFKGRGFGSTLRHVFSVLSGRQHRDPRIEHRRVHKVRIRPRELLFVQVDGEAVGLTPVEVAVLPRALHVLAPPGSPLASRLQP